MLLSSFFARSMAFTHTPKVQLPFALFSETFLTIRQNSLYVTVCIIARPSYRGYFIHSLSTLHYCNAPSLATRLTGDYRDRTYTGKCSPALLDTRKRKAAPVLAHQSGNRSSRKWTTLQTIYYLFLERQTIRKFVRCYFCTHF